MSAVCLWAGLLGLAWAEPGDLELAYQKEFVYLQAEKATLSRHAQELEVEGARKVAAAEAEAERLQGRLVRLGVELSRVQTELEEAQRSTWDAEEDVDRLRTLLVQAQESVGLAAAELPADPAAQGAALEQAFALASARIVEGGAVRVGPGRFFLADGVQVEGTVLTLGAVAAWGQSAQGSGVLAPAGEGRLQLSQPAPELVAALLAGQAPAAVPVVLYEGTERALSEPAQKTWRDILRAGGPIGLLILALGAVGAALTAWRLGVLARQPAADPLVDALEPLVAQGQHAQALALLPRGRAAGRVLAAVLERAGQPREALEEGAAQALLREAPAIERFGGAILVLAAVAPLMGLLGTVTGMITTFDVITELGTGDPKMLSGGISEALVTTEFGLVVAIPGVLLGNLLGARTEAVLGELERAALRLVERVAGQPARG